MPACAPVGAVTWQHVALALIAAINALGVAWIGARNHGDHRRIERKMNGHSGPT